MKQRKIATDSWIIWKQSETRRFGRINLATEKMTEIQFLHQKMKSLELKGALETDHEINRSRKSFKMHCQNNDKVGDRAVAAK